MNILSELKPASLWKHFENICTIPRPSKHESKILEHIKEFAKTHNLEFSQDDGGNIIIKKPAYPGFENCEIVALQAHVDMVPQKNANKQHDFTKDPIIPRIEGDWVKATGTTLGADNGIGLAAILAVLEDTNIQHGPIEAVLTTDEEAGMNGASALTPKALQAKYMINTDTEDEHDITVGCAGGIDANFYFDYEIEAAPQNAKLFTFYISGLTGGHSGFEIILHRANANVLIVDYADTVFRKYDARLVEIQGGNMRNAIPRESQVTFYIPNNNIDEFEKFTLEHITHLKTTYSKTDSLLHCVLTEENSADKIISEFDTHRILQALKNCPNGPISYEKGIVKTSTNISIIQTKPKQVEINCLLRSSDTPEKMKLANSMEQNFKLFEAKTNFEGDYPAWQPVWDSKILRILQKAYSELTSITPEVKVVHAGLECGIFSGKYPHMEFVSFGPNIRGPHSPDERVEIKSVEQFWNLLLYVLKNIPEKKYNEVTSKNINKNLN